MGWLSWGTSGAGSICAAAGGASGGGDAGAAGRWERGSGGRPGDNNTNFVATDKCKTVATNEISQGAKVVFQVAGGCGLGVFKAADDAGAWAIGVDVDPDRNDVELERSRCRRWRGRNGIPSAR